MLSSRVFPSKLAAMLVITDRPEKTKLGCGKRKVRGNQQVQAKYGSRVNVVFWVRPSGSHELFPGRDGTSL